MISVINVRNPNVLKNSPAKTTTIMKQGQIIQDEFIITKIELRLYVKDDHNNKDNRDTYSTITTFIKTDKGTVEMTYDEGFLGKNPLESATKMLTENLGLSALVLRCTIALRGHIADAKTATIKQQHSKTKNHDKTDASTSK